MKIGIQSDAFIPYKSKIIPYSLDLQLPTRGGFGMGFLSPGFLSQGSGFLKRKGLGFFFVGWDIPSKSHL